MALSTKAREELLHFIKQNACDDIIVAAAVRTRYNMEEAKSLREFIKRPPDLTPLDYIEKPEPAAPKTEEGEVEDLGPAPKKLGSNGQAIQKLMEKQRIDWTVEGVAASLKMPVSKAKPMLALLLERNIIKRSGKHTYVVA